MAHAEICPICGGKGKLPNDGKSTAVIEPICHGCGGRGWITVQDNRCNDGDEDYYWPVENMSGLPTTTWPTQR